LTLTPEERIFLQEIQQHPLWDPLLDKLTRKAITAYKPEDNVLPVFFNWLYDSGRFRENQSIISFLRGNHV